MWAVGKDAIGAYGTAIFTHDVAVDVRSDFRDLIGRGATPQDATGKVLAEYCVGDPFDPDNNDIWLSLAATQHKIGHVDEQVVRRAMEIAASTTELERWDAADQPARFQVLSELAQALSEPVPPPQAIKRRRLAATELVLGQHLLFTDSAEHCRFLLRVTQMWEDKGGRSPVFSVLDWDGEETSLEDPSTLELLPRRIRDGSERRYFGVMLVGRKPKKENLRLLPASAPAEPLDWSLIGMTGVAWDKLIYLVRREAAFPPIPLQGDSDTF